MIESFAKPDTFSAVGSFTRYRTFNKQASGVADAPQTTLLSSSASSRRWKRFEQEKLSRSSTGSGGAVEFVPLSPGVTGTDVGMGATVSGGVVGSVLLSPGGTGTLVLSPGPGAGSGAGASLGDGAEVLFTPGTGTSTGGSSGTGTGSGGAGTGGGVVSWHSAAVNPHS